jgi:hypothetical protein
MTIQIFELTIKMVVEDRQMKQETFDTTIQDLSKEELISECSEYVLKYLEQMKER